MFKQKLNDDLKRLARNELGYAEKFRGNQGDLGTNGTKGASVAPPTVIKHMIVNSGKPTSRRGG